MVPPALRAAAARQCDAVTIAQCRAAGLSSSWVDRRVRSGAWQRWHRGVFVVHSGPVPWRTRAWVAVLAAGPDAALSHGAAAYLHRMVDRPPDRIEVSVPADRRAVRVPGVLVHRRRQLPGGHGSPPRTTRESTALDLVAASRTDDEAVAWLAAAVRAGASTRALARQLTSEPTRRRRSLALELLGEVARGVESALEHRYVRDVERAHRLPRSSLQVRTTAAGRTVRSDALYDEYGVRVELDGAVWHDGARRDDDQWRDNAVLLEHGDITLRYRWRHVVGSPCAAALQVAAALRARGWTGAPRPCSPTCPAP